MAVRLRRLPIISSPAACETTGSYLGRLATLNHISFDEIRSLPHCSPLKDSAQMSADVLGQLTDYAPDRLLRALPDLAGRRIDSTIYRSTCTDGCIKCTARLAGGQVRRFVKHHQPFCKQHRVWHKDRRDGMIGIHVDALPGIVGAQRRHQRIVRRYGHARIANAFNSAHMFVERKNANSLASTRRDEVLNQVVPGWSRISIDNPAWKLAVYPDVIDLVAFMLSPHWRVTGRPSEIQARFWKELSRHVLYWQYYRPSYAPRFYCPLMEWLEGEDVLRQAYMAAGYIEDLVDLDRL